MRQFSLFFLGLILSFHGVAGEFKPANRPIDVLHYLMKLPIDPGADPDDFRATAEIKLKPKKSLKSFTLDVHNLTIKSVHLLGGKKRALKHEVKPNPIWKESEELHIFLPKTFKKGQTLEVSIRYEGKIQVKSHIGLFKVNDPDEPERGPLLFTQLEALGGRQFLPSNDEPMDKATTEIHALVPKKYDVISNGHLVKKKDVAIKGKQWHEFRWLQKKAHPTYLISLAIAPFQKENFQKSKPSINIWVGKTKMDKARFAGEASVKLVKYFENFLGVPYPWTKCDTLGVPKFFWGGMENTGAIHNNQERMLINDPLSSKEHFNVAGLVAHEIAHQWFGNSVTPKWWSDLWLNESFASYLDMLGAKHMFGTEQAELETVASAWDWYFRQEDGPRSHPIVNESLSHPDDAFDAISYTKGANMLRTLEYYVGTKTFRRSLKVYLRKHALGNTDYHDYFKVLSRVSKRNLDRFRDTWLLQKGYPVIQYSGTWNAKTKTYTLDLEQRSNHEGDPSLFHFKLPVTFAAKKWYRKRNIVMDKANHKLVVKLPAKPQWVSVNNGSVVLARVEQKQRDEAVLAMQLQNDRDPMIRMWAGRRLAEGLIDGSGLSETAENSLLLALQKDKSPYVRDRILGFFSQMKQRWLPKTLGDGLFQLAQDSLQPGYEKSEQFKKDSHGWRGHRSTLLGAVGLIQTPKALPFLAQIIQNPALPLDDLEKVASSIANLGDSKSAQILREAEKMHQGRGYRYKYYVLNAFGSYENPQAAAEIKRIADSGAVDILARIGWAVKDNQTLKNSKEWANFMEDICLDDDFGEDVKHRLLVTLEDVKTDHAKEALQTIYKNTKSDRMKENVGKILKKNFPEKKVG